MTDASSVNTLQAMLYSAAMPEPSEQEQIHAFLKEKYKSEITLNWTEDPSLQNGFRLEINGEVYDWSMERRFMQLQEQWASIAENAENNVISLLQESLEQWNPSAVSEEIGYVLSVGDGIAAVSGLEHAAYGEILIFSSGMKGMVQDLKKNHIGCILFGDDRGISEGSMVKRTGKTAGIPVGEEFLGRVINALGSPIDGKGKIHAKAYRPIETPAPGIINRQPVKEPLETGLLAIDSMFPIGKGQRELIIGDRQTGKTAIALDTILNQQGKDVICIYVAIGQKASSVAQLVEILRKRQALEYSVVVCASASETDPMQYIAPYAGCALGEYFMQKGRDVLIIYDDLSKHAIAYRTISLLLERSPGREAYPGDVFYLHSRLLERSAHLSEQEGGGSMTALPIVETQAGDVSAYIPTNIISITDGQIFLESDLFFSGQRPAVNVGLSVSRVGGDAQTKAMKSAAGAIRLELAQYREMEVFTQFSSDLDDTTKEQLIYGQGLMQLLKQKQYQPLKQYEQVILLMAALNHTLQKLPVNKIPELSRDFIVYMQESRPEICREINNEGILTPEAKQIIVKCAETFFAGYSGERR